MRLNPKRLLRARDVEESARLAVRLRRVPDDLAAESGRPGDDLGQLADRDLLARPKVDRVAAVVPLRGEHERQGGVLDVEKLSGRRSIAPEDDLALASLIRLEHLADQRRDYVRGLEVEVVARAVEVDRQEEDGIQAVLLTIGLRPHEQRLLRHAVGRVRLLGISVPEVGLAERDGGELGIRADRPGEDHLVHAGPAALFEHMCAHHQVRVPVAARVGHVRADASDFGREVEDEVRTCLSEQSLGVLREGQVVVATSGDERVEAFGLKSLDEM